MREVVVHPPRKLKRISVRLPEDQIAMLDDAAKALGLSRSDFLQIFLDSYAENVISFVTGWLTGIKYYQEKVEEEKRVEEAKKMAEALGTKLATRR